MHRTALLFGLIVFMLMGAASYFSAQKAVEFVEDSTRQDVSEALDAAGEDWAAIETDGLIVRLAGLAPDEASRLKALEIIGKIIETSRLEDKTTVLETTNIAPPRFSLEVLRNEDQVSLIGLIPHSQGRDQILTSVQALTNAPNVTDMLETADYPVSDAWNVALDFGLASLKRLPRSKISITAEKVVVTAVTESVSEKKLTEQYLSTSKPEGLLLEMNVSSPRPVISPFSLRFRIEGDKVELASCSADTEWTRAKILRAAADAGLTGKAQCNIGLGVPTTDWADATIMSMKAVKEFGGGVLTFTDSDVSLVAPQGTSQSDFDRIIGKLENRLPELFSLHAILPPKVLTDEEIAELDEPEFVATRSPEGHVQLRGRVSSDETKQAIDIYARSLFGTTDVYLQTRVDETLPSGWPIRVLGGLEALEKLHHGSLVVQPNVVKVRGIGARPDIPSEVTRVLSTRLGGKGIYEIDVEFDEKLFQINEEPTADDCQRGITALLAREQIVFAPASTQITAESLKVVSDIADILRKCPDAKFEIEGHTDSQGGKDLNLQISQRRAESVLNALLGQRVLTSGLTAKGYGPEKPIADNATEEGRAQNRRIAFRLIKDETSETAKEGDTENGQD